MKKFLGVLCGFAMLAGMVPARAADMDKLNERLNSAADVIQEIMATPDKGIPSSILAGAVCVVVIPSYKKGAFVVGAQYGQGAATCRTPRGWSAPVFVRLTGGSVGWQIGGQATDLVLIATTHDGFERLLHDKVKLGGDAAVAAGPVGRNAQASTTELANAGFLTYSRSKGIFAGVDLTGDVVNQNQEDTRAYYGGRDISYETILTGRVSTPRDARRFVHTVSVLFHASGERAYGTR